jgi:hypothetical protein
MNVQNYEQRLLELEKTLAARAAREAAHGRGEFIDSAHDVGDASVADEATSEAFTETGHDSAVLPAGARGVGACRRGHIRHVRRGRRTD